MHIAHMSALYKINKIATWRKGQGVIQLSYFTDYSSSKWRRNFSLYYELTLNTQLFIYFYSQFIAILNYKRHHVAKYAAFYAGR